jgi:hypothetical protein
LRPVFIGGVPRSGTTVLGSTLGAHSQAVVTPESEFVAHGVIRARAIARLHPDSWAAKLTDWLSTEPGFLLWGLSLDDDARAELGGATDPGDFFLRLVSLYAVRSGRPHADIWVEHSPANMRFAAVLQSAFPSARFIHLVRDGRAVVASILPLWWGPFSALAAAKWWSESVAYGLAASRTWPHQVFEARFERLAQDPEQSLQEIAAFIDIPNEQSLHEKRGLDLPANTRAQHALVDQPFDASRIDAWRTALKPDQIRTVERRAGGLLATLGYLSPTEVVYEVTPAKDHLLELLASIRLLWSLTVVPRIKRRERLD